MRILKSLQKLYLTISDGIYDIAIMWYVMWIIGTQDLREKFFDIDLDIKDREGK